MGVRTGVPRGRRKEVQGGDRAPARRLVSRRDGRGGSIARQDSRAQQSESSITRPTHPTREGFGMKHAVRKRKRKELCVMCQTDKYPLTAAQQRVQGVGGRCRFGRLCETCNAVL